MRKFLAIAAFAVVLLTAGVGQSRADNMPMDMTQAKGDCFVGFWDLNAPLAVRYMLTDNWEIGAGVGFHKPDEGDTEFDFAAMATYRLIHASKAHLGLRPRIYKEFNSPGELFAIGADLTVEVEISSAVSIVAGHGIEYLTENSDSGTPGAPRGSLSPLGSTSSGDDFHELTTRAVTGTSVGFWVKLP